MTTCKTRDWNKIIKKNHLSQWNSQDDDVQTPYLTVSAKLVKGLCMQGEYKSFCSWFDICHRCVQIQSVAFRGSDPADRSSFWQLYGVQEGKKSSFRSHTQNTVLISSCFDFVSCRRCVQGLERRYEKRRSSCIVLYFLQIHLSYQVINVLKLEKSYFWNITDL